MKLARPSIRRTLVLRLTILTVFLASVVVLIPITSVGAADDTAAPPPLMPVYDEGGNLLLPEDYPTWVFIGSSLGLGYSESTGDGGMEMFHHTLMEPTAYQHFRQTGTFREGTMLALLLHNTGEGVLPARRGRFASSLLSVEMAVKDSSRVEETWAYYNFGRRQTAQPLAARACQSCHVEHAAHDNVFVQFYPLLADAAPPGTLPASLVSASTAPAAAESDGASGAGEGGQAEAALALAGLDPVHLVAGHEELGKKELTMEVDDYRYQFASEASMQTFAAEPSRYIIQNETCPMVPGAAIDPSLVTVYEGKIYAFASPTCVEQFNADPARFVGGIE